VLRKRERYREVFDAFDPEKVASYGAKKVKQLLADPGIIRNRLKIAATISNAREFLESSKNSAASTRTSGALLRRPSKRLET